MTSDGRDGDGGDGGGDEGGDGDGGDGGGDEGGDGDGDGVGDGDVQATVVVKVTVMPMFTLFCLLLTRCCAAAFEIPSYSHLVPLPWTPGSAAAHRERKLHVI